MGGDRMGSDWGYYGLIIGIFVILLRLERLGKQIEAVSTRIRIDVARTKEERDEIMTKWKETLDTKRKDRRQFWIFWGIMLALAVGVWFVTHRTSY